jgi:hypothetical protein
MKESILAEKSFDFAIRIINLYKYLTENKKEFVMSKQLLRSGTAIGAMQSEGHFAESKLDFTNIRFVTKKNIDRYYLLRTSKIIYHKSYTKAGDENFKLYIVSIFKETKAKFLFHKNFCVTFVPYVVFSFD